jgi:hypothetical protein
MFRVASDAMGATTARPKVAPPGHRLRPARNNPRRRAGSSTGETDHRRTPLAGDASREHPHRSTRAQSSTHDELQRRASAMREEEDRRRTYARPSSSDTSRRTPVVKPPGTPRRGAWPPDPSTGKACRCRTVPRTRRAPRWSTDTRSVPLLIDIGANPGLDAGNPSPNTPSRCAICRLDGHDVRTPRSRALHIWRRRGKATRRIQRATRSSLDASNLALASATSRSSDLTQAHKTRRRRPPIAVAGNVRESSSRGGLSQSIFDLCGAEVRASCRRAKSARTC